jgi:TonB family protein
VNAKIGCIVISVCVVIALVAISGFSGPHIYRVSATRTQTASNPGLPKGVQVDLPRNLNNTDRDPGILKESSAIVSISTNDRIYVGSELTSKEDLGSRLSRFLALQKEPNKLVYLAVGVEVDYGAVLKIIYQLRNLGVDRVGLMTGGEPDSQVPYRILVQIPAAPKPIKGVEWKPNPLTLLVTISPDLKIALNTRDHPEAGEPCFGLVKDYGSSNDASPLTQCLTRLFRKRIEEHAYRLGMEMQADLPESERIERTVFVKASDSTKYGDFIRVIDTVKGAGANPISFNLQDDDLLEPLPSTRRPAKRRAPISGGIMNGKAISLPQPAYPAIRTKASGTVVIQVLIDESGKVISVHAVSGHPLLLPSAIKAAREARFTPTVLSGEPVKVIGVVVYKFTAP